mmetsp:Transcript_27227/g.85739  ORF Transcript_27227/g.85739 Transcript_27227/m.85739 type:complete len:240 (+) Transcript_27227:2028-2747(+)
MGGLIVLVRLARDAADLSGVRRRHLVHAVTIVEKALLATMAAAAVATAPAAAHALTVRAVDPRPRLCVPRAGSRSIGIHGARRVRLPGALPPHHRAAAVRRIAPRAIALLRFRRPRCGLHGGGAVAAAVPRGLDQLLEHATLAAAAKIVAVVGEDVRALRGGAAAVALVVRVRVRAPIARRAPLVLATDGARRAAQSHFVVGDLGLALNPWVPEELHRARALMRVALEAFQLKVPDGLR